MHAEPVFASAVARSVRTRVELLAAALEQDGRSRPEALAVATLILGVPRGLPADLLLTGDDERVTAAFDVFAGGRDPARGQRVAAPADRTTLRTPDSALPPVAA